MISNYTIDYNNKPLFLNSIGYSGDLCMKACESCSIFINFK